MQIGEAFVAIRPDTSGFTAELQGALSSAAQPVEVPVGAQTEEAQSEIESLAGGEVDVEVGANAEEAQTEIDSLSGGDVTVEVGANADPAQSEIDSLSGGEVTVEVAANTDQAQGAIDQLSAGLSLAGGRAAAAGGQLGGFAAAASNLESVSTGAAVGIGALGLGLAASVRAAGEAEAVQRTVAAVIEATGGAANVTADQVLALASDIQSYSGFSDEAVASAERLLLTFRNVRNEAGAGNDIFNRATEALADLSRAGFGDLESNAVRLGRALQDPVQGLTALARAGVTFSQAQRDAVAQMVASGDTLGAQRLILAEIENQVGGVAAAYGDTLPGQLDRAREALGEAAEAAGAVLVPALEDAISAAENLAGAGDLLDTAFSGVGDLFGSVLPDDIEDRLGSPSFWDQARERMSAFWQSLGTGLDIDVSHVGEIADGLNHIGEAAALLAAHADSDDLENLFNQILDVDPAGGREAIDQIAAAFLAAGGDADVLNAALDRLPPAADAAGEAAGGAGDAADRAAEQWRQASDAIDGYVEAAFASQNVAVDLASAQRDLFESLNASRQNFRANSEAGAENIQNMEAWVSAVGNAVQAGADFAANGGNVEVAQRRVNNAITDGISTLQRMRDAGLITQQQFERYADVIRGLPPARFRADGSQARREAQTTSDHINRALSRQFRAFLGANGAPARREAQVTAEHTRQQWVRRFVAQLAADPASGRRDVSAAEAAVRRAWLRRWVADLTADGNRGRSEASRTASHAQRTWARIFKGVMDGDSGPARNAVSDAVSYALSQWNGRTFTATLNASIGNVESTVDRVQAIADSAGESAPAAARELAAVGSGLASPGLGARTVNLNLTVKADGLVFGDEQGFADALAPHVGRQIEEAANALGW